MITRRGFFKALAGAAAVAFTHTVDIPASITPPPPKMLELPRIYPTWIEFANTVAFNWVSQAMPEHGEYWRKRALVSMRKVMETKHGREWIMRAYKGPEDSFQP